MIRLGSALKCMEYPYHRCLIISDPERNGGIVLLVRITTDDGTWPDRDCLLTPHDWDQLEHPSTVAYSTCKHGRASAALEQAIQRGLFQESASPSLEVLRKVIAAAGTANGMPPGARRFVAQV